MFNATQNGIQLRMFSVMVRNHETRNKLLSEKLMQEQPKLFAHFMGLYDVQDGEDLQFFSGPPKEYPVLASIGKSQMRLEAPPASIISGAPPQQQAVYTENDYLMIPDNFGYMRVVHLLDLAISTYETPLNTHIFKYLDNAILTSDPDIKIEPNKSKEDSNSKK